MKFKIQVVIFFSIIISIAITMAQISLPLIPGNFTVTLGNLPQPLPNQKISICDYKQTPTLREVQVFSNEVHSIGVGNITYSFQIEMPNCQKSYYESFTYSVLNNPVQEIEQHMRQTVINSIRVPQINPPIAIGSSG